MTFIRLHVLFTDQTPKLPPLPTPLTAPVVKFHSLSSKSSLRKKESMLGLADDG